MLTQRLDLSQKVAGEAYDVAATTEPNPRSVWGYVQGLTRLSQPCPGRAGGSHSTRPRVGCSPQSTDHGGTRLGLSPDAQLPPAVRALSAIMHGERRNFALLRAVRDLAAQQALRELVLEAYVAEAAAADE